MSEQSSSSTDIDPHCEEKSIAVGIIGTGTNSEAVARTALRARERKYKVLLTHHGDPDIESVRFARTVGATVVSPSDRNPSMKSLRQRLRNHAKANGLDGILYQTKECQRIDFERSEQRLKEDQFAVETVAKTDEYDGTPSVLIGIPAYNEKSTISNVVTQASRYGGQVLVVDDGSTDETARQAKEAGAIVNKHETNHGYGAALQTLFRQAHRRSFDHIVVIDADGQHEITDIPKLISCQQQTGSEIVIGSRFVSGAKTNVPVIRRLGLSVINVMTNFSLGNIRPSSWITDTQSGFRAYSQDAVKNLVTEEGIGNRMGASVDILYHANKNGYQIEEIETNVDYSMDSSSTHHPLFHGLAVVRNIIRIVERERPVSTLGIPGLVVTVIGLLFSFWTVQNYVISGSFPYGLGISSAFFFLSGVFTTFTSIILHSLSRHRVT